jgi:hypothetical protein
MENCFGWWTLPLAACFQQGFENSRLSRGRV